MVRLNRILLGQAAGFLFDFSYLNAGRSVAIGSALAEHWPPRFGVPDPQRIGRDRNPPAFASMISHLKLSSVVVSVGYSVLGSPIGLTFTDFPIPVNAGAGPATANPEFRPLDGRIPEKVSFPGYQLIDFEI